MITYILFILGFIFLIQGANFLVDGAASIARRFNISSIVIGLTIVAFGTSAPELIVNVFASTTGNAELAIGNILGSNIANILLILGISSLIHPLVAKNSTVWKEIPMSLLAAILLGVMVNDNFIDGDDPSGLSRIDGIVFLGFFVIFMYYTFGIAKSDNSKEDNSIQSFTLARSVLFVVLGLIGLTLGGKWIVDGALTIAKLLHMSESVIGLTVVAVGTSLPELATSAIAAFKKQSDIAIGNVIGSNIFNIFWILGVSAIISPLPFQESSTVDILMTIMTSLLMFIVLFVGRRNTIERWQGGILVSIYFIYITYLIMR